MKDFCFCNFTATPSTSRGIFRLNSGGHIYTTLKSTLNKYISIALLEMLKNCDEKGNVLINRDGRMFYYILWFLRTGQLCLDFSDFHSLTKEVKYFDIPMLISCLEEAKNKRLCFKYIELWKQKWTDMSEEY